MRLATPADRDLLVDLMAEFYAEAGYAMDRERAGRAFAALLADPRLGRAWVIEHCGAAAGYVVLALGFSMEYGGADAFVDDLFVRPPFRGAGLGRAALAGVRAACRELGVRALHLAVEPDNVRAEALYHRVGFRTSGRRLLTLRIEPAAPPD